MPITNRRTVFLNGEYMPEADAKVSVFDRGFLMSDAVYEYTAVIEGRLLEFDHHLQRLQRSLDELDFDLQLDREELLFVHRELVRLNKVDVGGVYIQISRGATDRDFAFPKGLTPTVMAFTQEMNFLDNPINDTGLKVMSVEDGRWARRDIKSVQLLYTSMVKSKAEAAGLHDAFFVKDGFVTEATASNAFIVKDGKVITRQLSSDILHGVTRKVVLALAAENELTIEERPFSIQEAQDADEVFVTASPTFALPVVELDGKPIADAKPGPMTQKLRNLFLKEARLNAL